MSARFPKANWKSTSYTNANLSTATLAIINGLTAEALTFPLLPVPVATMQADLNNYNTSLAISIDGSKAQRAQMQLDREQVRIDIRDNGQYVNQVIQSIINAGSSYAAARALIALTGYPVSLDPSPVGPLTQAVIKKFSSPAPEQLYVLVDKIHGARTYSLNWGIAGSERSTWITEVYPNTRILKTDAPSGTNIVLTVNGNGASGISTESNPVTQIII